MANRKILRQKVAESRHQVHNFRSLTTWMKVRYAEKSIAKVVIKNKDGAMTSVWAGMATRNAYPIAITK